MSGTLGFNHPRIISGHLKRSWSINRHRQGLGLPGVVEPALTLGERSGTQIKAQARTLFSIHPSSCDFCRILQTVSPIFTQISGGERGFIRPCRGGSNAGRRLLKSEGV